MPELGDTSDRTSSSQQPSKDSLQVDTSLISTSPTSDVSSDSLGARYKLGTTINPQLQRAFRYKNSSGSGGTNSASTTMEVDRRIEDGGRDGGKTTNAEHMLPTSDGIALSEHVTGNEDDDERTAAHTSTKVKSLTPFSLRSRRDDAISLLTMTQADDARRSCGALNTASFNLDTTSSSFKDVSMPNLANYRQRDKHYPAQTGGIQDGAALTGLHRSVASVDDVRPPSVTSLLEPPGTVPTDVTSTVQTTSAELSPAVQLTTETGVSSASDKRRLSAENVIPDRASPRPRTNIYANIRQRVFGTKQPATDQQQVLKGSEAKESVTEKLTSTEPPVSVTSEMASHPVPPTSTVATPAAHLLTPGDGATPPASHLLSTTQNLPAQSVSTPLTQTSSPNLATSAAIRPSSLFSISSSSMSEPAVSSDVSVANTGIVQASTASVGSSQTQTSTGHQTLAEKLGFTKSSSVIQSQNEQQPAASGRVTAPVRRPVATAEVSPWTKTGDTMNYPGTQYNLRQQPESKTDAQVENLMLQNNQVRSATDLPRGTTTVQQVNNLQTLISDAAQQQQQQQQLTASTRPEETLRRHPVSSTAIVQPVTIIPAADAGTVARGKIVPSSVSRVDWAKQRFGSAQPLDSNFGFAAVSTDTSPKATQQSNTASRPNSADDFVDTHRSVQSALVDRQVLPSTATESSATGRPRTDVPTSVTGSGIRLSVAASLPDKLPQPSPVTARLPTTMSTAMPPVFSSPSNVAIVHGLQVPPAKLITSAGTLPTLTMSTPADLPAVTSVLSSTSTDKFALTGPPAANGSATRLTNARTTAFSPAPVATSLSAVGRTVNEAARRGLPVQDQNVASAVGMPGGIRALGPQTHTVSPIKFIPSVEPRPTSTVPTTSAVLTSLPSTSVLPVTSKVQIAAGPVANSTTTQVVDAMMTAILAPPVSVAASLAAPSRIVDEATTRDLPARYPATMLSAAGTHGGVHAAVSQPQQLSSTTLVPSAEIRPTSTTLSAAGLPATSVLPASSAALAVSGVVTRTVDTRTTVNLPDPVAAALPTTNRTVNEMARLDDVTRNVNVTPSAVGAPGSGSINAVVPQVPSSLLSADAAARRHFVETVPPSVASTELGFTTPSFTSAISAGRLTTAASATPHRSAMQIQSTSDTQPSTVRDLQTVSQETASRSSLQSPPVAEPKPDREASVLTCFSVQEPLAVVRAKPALPTVVVCVAHVVVPEIRLTAQPLESVVVFDSEIPESRLVLVEPIRPGQSATSPAVRSTTSSSLSETVRQPPFTGSQINQIHMSTSAVSVAHQREPLQSNQPQGIPSTRERVSLPPSWVDPHKTDRYNEMGRSDLERSGRVPQSMGDSNLTAMRQRTGDTGTAAVASLEATTSRTAITLPLRQTAQVAPSQPRVSYTQDSIQRTSPLTTTYQTVSKPTRSIETGAKTSPSLPVTTSLPSAGQSYRSTDTGPPGTGQQGGRRSTESTSPQISSISRPGRADNTVPARQTTKKEDLAALAELDTIAAETRMLSKSLTRGMTLPASTTVTPRITRTLTLPSSTAGLVVSPRGSSLTEITARLMRSPDPAAAPALSSGNLDGSGIIRKNLVHLESILRPAPESHVKKSVHLRKPKPLRKAQTVDITSLGVGVDRELASLLVTRKEKSASDDEEANTKSNQPGIAAQESRLDDKEPEEDDDEKLPSVAERIKKMETKKIRFTDLRERAAKRRLAQSMESLPTSSDSAQPHVEQTDQRSLDRLASFAAISDTSVAEKRRQLQRRHLAKGRRLSHPDTLNELNKVEALQSVVGFRAQVTKRTGLRATPYTNQTFRWIGGIWQRPFPSARERVAAELPASCRIHRRRRSLPPRISRDVGDNLPDRQKAIMLKSCLKTRPTAAAVRFEDNERRSAPDPAGSIRQPPRVKIEPVGQVIGSMTPPQPVRSPETSSQSPEPRSYVSTKAFPDQISPAPTVSSQWPGPYATSPPALTVSSKPASVVEPRISTSSQPTAQPLSRSEDKSRAGPGPRRRMPAVQRTDSIDEDEFDKLVEINYLQLVEPPSTSEIVSTAKLTLSPDAAKSPGSLSPRMARRASPLQQSTTQGIGASDARSLRGPSTGTAPTSREGTSPQRPRTYQQAEEKQAENEQSEDELSKLSVADKLKLFSPKKPGAGRSLDKDTKSRRQMSRYQTQPVTLGELEQAHEFSTSRDTGNYGRAQYASRPPTGFGVQKMIYRDY